jgi:hypothetical protein
MQELVRLNKSGFLPLLGAGSWGFLGRKETKVCPGGERVFWRYCWNKDRLLVRIKTFWHKNFEPKNKKNKSYTRFFSCMSLVWFNTCVKSRFIHMAFQ